jgi:hypothetical protein
MSLLLRRDEKNAASRNHRRFSQKAASAVAECAGRFVLRGIDPSDTANP